MRENADTSCGFDRLEFIFADHFKRFVIQRFACVNLKPVVEELAGDQEEGFMFCRVTDSSRCFSDDFWSPLDPNSVSDVNLSHLQTLIGFECSV